MKTLQKRLGLLALVTAFVFPTAAQALNLDLELVNGTGWAIKEVYISPATVNDWQENVISKPMDDGDSYDITFHPDADVAKWDTEFVGAHAINQARLFNSHPTGATLADERLDTLMGEGGVNDCGNAQNCVKVCPKEIPLTESIAAIGRAVTVHAVKKFFSGRE